MGTRLGYRYVEPFSLNDGAFNDYMVDLPIVVSLLPLGVKIGVGASSDC
jgi:hypothetical protein